MMGGDRRTGSPARGDGALLLSSFGVCDSKHPSPHENSIVHPEPRSFHDL